MNAWAQGFFGRPIDRRLAHAARLHDEDLPRPRPAPRRPARPPRRRRRLLGLDRRRRRSTSSTTTRALRDGRRVDRAVPAEDPDGRRSGALERHPDGARSSTSGLAGGTIKVYVLVEQIEACFQLMEIRAALGPHFVGFNTGRWDYINSVSDAMAWDPAFVNPNIDAITMTYGYMRALRGPRAPRRQHARPHGPVRAVAGRHGAEHSRSARRPASPPA